MATCNINKRFISLVAACVVIWSALGVLQIYDWMAASKPSAITTDTTYQAAPPLVSSKIKTGIYSIEIIQPVTVFGRVEHLVVYYIIEKTVDGSHWVASRRVKINGSSFDLGADVFRTKSDAIKYISNTGRYMDYGVGKNIGIGGVR